MANDSSTRYISHSAAVRLGMASEAGEALPYDLSRSVVEAASATALEPSIIEDGGAWAVDADGDMTWVTAPASPYRYAVTGDFDRMVYSRHRTRAAAERACRALANKWGHSHPGSEPRVVEVATDDTAHGITFAAWLAAAGRSDSASEYDLRAAWRAGEDPAEYAV